MIAFRVVAGTGFDSAMVQKTTRSWATHAEFVNTDTGKALGAYLSGVAERPLAYARFKREEWYTAPNVEYAYHLAATQIGKKYDYSAIFGIFLNRNWRSADRWFCSELVAWSFEQAASPLLNPTTAVYRITPRDLLLSTRILGPSADAPTNDKANPLP